MNYRIGLDIGIASVGWAVIEDNTEGKPKRIVDLGVRAFEPAENPKDGSSLAVDRRVARGLRRRLRRRKRRIEDCKLLLNKTFDIDSSNLNEHNVYELRFRALNSLLTKEELASVLKMFVKRRGFKSNRKAKGIKLDTLLKAIDKKEDIEKLAEKESSENGEVLKSISANEKIMKEKSYRTVGEMIFNEAQFFEMKTLASGQTIKLFHARNKFGDYSKCFSRIEIEKEIKIILDSQRKFGNKLLTDEFEQKYLEVFNRQRNFDEGPGAPSPYGGNFRVGTCTLLPKESRAPKGSVTAEYFTALQKINNLQIVSFHDSRKLTEEERKKIIDLFWSKEKVKFSQIRTLLDLSNDDRFNLLTYSTKPSRKKKDGDTQQKELTIDELRKKTEDATFILHPTSYALSKILQLSTPIYQHKNLLNELASMLSLNKSDEKRTDAFYASEILKPYLQNMNALLAVDTSKFSNLSIKAMELIIPHLEKGLNYYDACTAAGFNANKIGGKKSELLVFEDYKNELEDITSPVVKRSVAQTIKVVNCILRKYGKCDAIFVELAREMQKSHDERAKIKKQNDENHSRNEQIINKLKNEFGILKPSGQDIVKYKLYEEQGGQCAYSFQNFETVLGSVKNIFDNNNTQIDHIIPYSKCYDDSISNKVLVLASENQQKGNQLPFEYFGSDIERWNKFFGFVSARYANNRMKAQKLLKQSLSLDQEQELNSRALNDTSYIARFVKNLMENHLLFAKSELSKKPVRTVNGFMTSYLRKVWGISKERFASDIHHSSDAAIIACTTNDMIQEVSKYCQLRDKYRFVRKNNQYLDITTGELLSQDELLKQYGQDAFRWKNYTQDETVLMEQFGPKFNLRPYIGFANELKLRQELQLDTNGVLRPEYAVQLKKLGYAQEDLQTIKPVFISRMPNRKVKGQIHDQTIRSKQILPDGNSIILTKTPITKLQLESKKDKNGVEKFQIKDYPEKLKVDDQNLYEALLNKLIEFNGNAKLAFKETFYKPSKFPNSKNPVKTVKLEKKSDSGVLLEKNQGYANNSSMVRVDVFKKNNKNYFVPIYIKDVYAGVLPSKAISGKSESKWIDITQPGFKFLFSLYPNDLVYIKTKKDLNGHISEKETGSKQSCKFNNCFLYYSKCDRTNGYFDLLTHDRSYYFHHAVLSNTEIFEKYEVDVLGNIHKINKETRQPFHIKKS